MHSAVGHNLMNCASAEPLLQTSCRVHGSILLHDTWNNWCKTLMWFQPQPDNPALHHVLATVYIIYVASHQLSVHAVKL